MTTLPFDIDDPVLAVAAWSRLTEPADADAIALVRALGPSEALRWLLGTWAEEVNLGPGTKAAVERWRVRLDGLDPRRELRVLAALGGVLLTPDSPDWPVGLNDLGATTPLCLWVMGGDAALASLTQPAVAVVGCRACTRYGEVTTVALVRDLAEAGFGIISGGAFGIDAAAHQAALAVGGATVAVMAGGVDRLYPAGNLELLRAIAQAGAVVSEVPPGSAPRKERFLKRNRLIAAMGRATVVVESAWRSGAHRTAAVAAELLRGVGAVPGPVTSAASAGCHRLIRDGVATLVADASQVRELAGPIGEAPEALIAVSAGLLDGLTSVERSVLDAVPLRRPALAGQVAASAGLPVAQVLATLGRLEGTGLVRGGGGAWRRDSVACAKLVP